MTRRLLLVLVSLALLIPAFAHAEEIPYVQGPVLVAQLPLDATLVGTEVIEDGYMEMLTTADGLADIVLLRSTIGQNANDIALQLYPDMQDVTEVEQAAIAGYPAVRLDFTHEDGVHSCTLVAFDTDAYTFAFAVDYASDAADYPELIDWWIETLDVFDDSAYELTEPTGLVLTAAIDAELMYLGADVQDNGDYTEIYVTGDALANLLFARRMETADAQELLTELFPDATEVLEAEQEPVLTYPATRHTFLTGESDNIGAGTMITFTTDNGMFAFIALVEADAYAGSEYPALIETWISTLDLIER